MLVSNRLHVKDSYKEFTILGDCNRCVFCSLFDLLFNTQKPKAEERLCADPLTRFAFGLVVRNFEK